MRSLRDTRLRPMPHAGATVVLIDTRSSMPPARAVPWQIVGGRALPVARSDRRRRKFLGQPRRHRHRRRARSCACSAARATARRPSAEPAVVEGAPPVPMTTCAIGVVRIDGAATPTAVRRDRATHISARRARRRRRRRCRREGHVHRARHARVDAARVHARSIRRGATVPASSTRSATARGHCFRIACSSAPAGPIAARLAPPASCVDGGACATQAAHGSSGRGRRRGRCRRQPAFRWVPAASATGSPDESTEQIGASTCVFRNVARLWLGVVTRRSRDGAFAPPASAQNRLGGSLRLRAPAGHVG